VRRSAGSAGLRASIERAALGGSERKRRGAANDDRTALRADLVVLGKSTSSGIPLGAYGMTAAVARVLEIPPASFGEGVATGARSSATRSRWRLPACVRSDGALPLSTPMTKRRWPTRSAWSESGVRPARAGAPLLISPTLVTAGDIVVTDAPAPPPPPSFPTSKDQCKNGGWRLPPPGS
jgi:hypothetical protein